MTAEGLILPLRDPAWGSRRCARGSKVWVGRSRCGAHPARVRRLRSGFPWGTVLELLDVYNAFSYGVDDGLGPIEDVQLPVDVRGVVAHRFLRDVQRTSDLPIAHTLSQGPYHLELPLGERRGQPRAPGTSPLEGAEHLLGELWGDYGIPGVNRADGAREILGFRVLQQVALRTGLDALEDVLVFLVAREDDDRGLRQKIPELARGADAVHLGHGDIHQDHVRLFFAAQLDALLAVVGYTDHLHAGQHVHEARNALGEKSLVVHDRHPDDLFVAVAQESHTTFFSKGQHSAYCTRLPPRRPRANGWGSREPLSPTASSVRAASSSEISISRC